MAQTTSLWSLPLLLLAAVTLASGPTADDLSDCEGICQRNDPV